MTKTVTLHYHPGIPWHDKRAPAFIEGLAKLNITCNLTLSQTRVSGDAAILFGTTRFKAIEEDYNGDFLLVDRACFGDPEYVRLGWNGRNLAADYMVPSVVDSQRWEAHGIKLRHWPVGDRIILCGEDNAPDDWYQRCISRYGCTHFKPHPALHQESPGLPVVSSFERALRVITWNSTVGVECVIKGIDTFAGDAHAMINSSVQPLGDRRALMNWLAWTQWSWQEIANGSEIAHLFSRCS